MSARTAQTVQPDGAARRRGPRLVRRLLLVLLWIDVGLLLWTWLSEGQHLTVSGVAIGGPDIQVPLLVLLGLSAALALARPARRRWLAQRLAGAQAAIRSTPPVRRLGMLATLVLAGFALASLADLPSAGMWARARARQAALPGYSNYNSVTHLPHLLSLVARLPDEQPLVVSVDDHDARALNASYYCYPRGATRPSPSRAPDRTRQGRCASPPSAGRCSSSPIRVARGSSGRPPRTPPW
jgi:hypothetical protein